MESSPCLCNEDLGSFPEEDLLGSLPLSPDAFVPEAREEVDDLTNEIEGSSSFLSDEGFEEGWPGGGRGGEEEGAVLG